MNILVTGGLGAVGSHLVKELRARNYNVVVADLQHNNSESYYRVDVGQYRQLERIFDREAFDFVFHLAAEFGRWNGEDFYETMWNTNAIGTKNILRLQKQHGFRQIFFSSSEVYGDWSDLMTEDVLSTQPLRQMNDYAISKWANELQIMNSAQMDKTETVRVRLFNTYGPGEYYSPYRSAICRFVYCAIHDLPYTVYLSHTRTATYITDCAHTLANILDNFIPGEVYNIGGKDYHTIKEASDLVLKHTGKSGTLVSYKDSEPFTTKYKKVDVTKAIRDLRHNPIVGLDEGIRKTVDWMRFAYARRL
jgi:dTDP-glucose 4,6-dehydratase